VVECKRCSSGKHDGESTDGDVEPIRSIAEAIRTFIEGLHGRAGSSAI
jgi:hypothetical protein